MSSTYILKYKKKPRGKDNTLHATAITQGE